MRSESSGGNAMLKERMAGAPPGPKGTKLTAHFRVPKPGLEGQARHQHQSGSAAQRRSGLAPRKGAEREGERERAGHWTENNSDNQRMMPFTLRRSAGGRFSYSSSVVGTTIFMAPGRGSSTKTHWDIEELQTEARVDGLSVEQCGRIMREVY
jgi:hypothetical protein